MALSIPAGTAYAAKERVGDGSTASPFWAEHRSRYRFAAGHVAGARVLDVACGEGWGARMLAEAGARSVIGVDSSAEAIEAARRDQAAPGVRFELGDALALALPDSSVDVAVSFETIEHLEQREHFVEELRRVLAGDGLLLLSTPNATHTRPVAGVPRNPFHVHEYTATELAMTLNKSFGSVELRGQRVRPDLRPCPYWERPSVRSHRGRAMLWKLLVRLPGARRDRVAERLLGHPLYPGEDGFVFDPGDAEAGHVLLAVCRP